MSDWDNPPASGGDDWNSDSGALQERAPNAEPAFPEKFVANDAAANIKLVEGANWVKPVPYNYPTASATRDAVDGGQPNAENTQDTPAENEETQNTAGIHGGWGHNAPKYEWSDEYGDVGPRVAELEKQLFENQFCQRVGDSFAKLAVGGELKVTVESETKINPIENWKDAALHPVMVENLKLCKYNTPTAIQGYCVPAITSNYDVVAISQTGSGKTAAYLIPILSKLMGKAKKLAAKRPGPNEDILLNGNQYRAEPLVLVIVPTRELATQIFDEARRLSYRSMLRPCVAYGGAPRREQLFELKRGCDILIATPGRLMDFMNDGALLSMSRVRYTVIDEADELVSPDWSEDMKRILTGADANQDADHRYMMFSATFPKEARALAKEHLADDHVRLRVGRIGSTHQNVGQNIVWVEEDQKQKALFDLLLSMPPARTIVFVNNKRAADYLDDFLYNNGMPSTSIHSDRTQREREDSLRSFRSGKTPILVATGVSARGWDIWNVMHVVNYDLPSGEHGGIQEYVHRIGRTARIGHNGHSTSFYNDRNEDIRDGLVKILWEAKQPIPDFFEELKPKDGEEVDFDDNSDDEGDAKTAAAAATAGDTWGADGNAGAGDDTWGAGGDAAIAAPAADDGWGAGSGPGPVAQDGGW